MIEIRKATQADADAIFRLVKEFAVSFIQYWEIFKKTLSVLLRDESAQLTDSTHDSFRTLSAEQTPPMTLFT